ncbi:hypothetical protein ACSRUE_45395 [Sorangium sp. KYC3313]|uniref:hypothetical protein n=1 Tax=Sorangium sp. KYC3313 TaxID=3449740 RepID=UPI003F8B6705
MQRPGARSPGSRLLPIYATDGLGVGPQGFGFLRAAPAVGAGLMAVVLAFRPHHAARRPGPAVSGSYT